MPPAEPAPTACGTALNPEPVATPLPGLPETEFKPTPCNHSQNHGLPALSEPVQIKTPQQNPDNNLKVDPIIIPAAGAELASRPATTTTTSTQSGEATTTTSSSEVQKVKSCLALENCVPDAEKLAKLEKARESLAATIKQFVKNIEDPVVKSQISTILKQQVQKINKEHCPISGRMLMGGKHMHLPEELHKVISTSQDWQKLAKAFDHTFSVALQDGKIASAWIDYEHLFNPIIKANCKKGTIEISGFHHDYMGKIRESGLIKFTERVEFDGGFYESRWSYGNAQSKLSSFFPDNWSPSKIISKIEEAFKNPVQESTIYVNNSYSLVGMTNDGTKIQLVFRSEQNGHTMKLITAFPILGSR